MKSFHKQIKVTVQGFFNSARYKSYAPRPCLLTMFLLLMLKNRYNYAPRSCLLTMSVLLMLKNRYSGRMKQLPHKYTFEIVNE